MNIGERIALGGAVATGVGSLVSMVGVFLVYRQLRRMVEANRTMAESNKLANAMAVVAIEEAIRSARADVASAATEVLKKKNDPDQDLELERLSLEEKTERYLNVLDRLCSYIRRGYIDEETYRQDYRRGIAETIEQHWDKFGPDTRHPNVLHVHDAWRDDRSCRDRSLS